MAKVDLETILADVKATMVAHFNAKLTALNTEKNDGITLLPLDGDAYFLQQLNGKLANWNPICVYGCDNIETISRGPFAGSKFTLSVMIVAADSGTEVECAARMFRYLRALEEIFRTNWTGGSAGIKFEVTSLVPIPLTELNTSSAYRGCGVQLDGSLG